MRENTPIDLNGDAPGQGRRVALRPGLNVEVVEVKLEAGRVHRFRAVYEPDVLRNPDGTTRLSGDTTTENNRGEAFTITPGKGSVCIADGVRGGDGSGTGGAGTVAPRHSRVA